MADLLRRHIMMQAGGGGILPSEYQQVEWIERKTRTSNIGSIYNVADIGNYKIETKFELISANNVDGYIYSGGYNQYGGIGLWYNQQKVYCISNWRVLELESMSFNTQYEVVEENTSISINGNAHSKSYYFYREYGLYPFANQYYQFDDFRMWYFKLTNNGVLVRDLYPCYRKADNVKGMYDIIGGTFYAGSGTFDVGNNV